MTDITAPLPRVRHRRKGQFGGWAWLTVAFALAAFAVTPFVLRSPAARLAPPAVTAPAAGFRICPVADCSRYPRPGGIRAIALSSLENWLLFTRSAESQIRAVSTPGHPRWKSWHGNAIRLQILQDKLVGPKGNLWSPGYYHSVQHIIGYALHRHLAVIVNAQTEPATGFPENEQGPTAATYSFWRHFTRSYGHNPRVVFDLFNEPRCEPHNQGNQTKVCGWAVWQAKMWPLARYVRSIGSQNQLWLEGKAWGSQLGGVPLVPCQQRVAWCQGLVYSFHKPGCPWPNKCAPTERVWWHQFGYLAEAGVPVVNGEMTNYRGGYDWSRSTETMGNYLRCLHQWGIGVVAWSLQPGIMIATADLTSAVSEPEGAGRIFWRYFHHEALPAGACAE
jgi:hypothetical protein